MAPGYEHAEAYNAVTEKDSGGEDEENDNDGDFAARNVLCEG